MRLTGANINPKAPGREAGQLNRYTKRPMIDPKRKFEEHQRRRTVRYNANASLRQADIQNTAQVIRVRTCLAD